MDSLILSEFLSHLESIGPVWTLVLSLALALGFGCFVLLTYLLTCRWSSPRIKKRVFTVVNPYVGPVLNLYTLELSQKEAFVDLGEGKHGNLPHVGDPIRLSFHISTIRRISCDAVVSRVCLNPEGGSTRGIEFRFTNFKKLHQRAFQKFLKSA